MSSSLKRWAPLAVLAILAVTAFAFDLHCYLTLKSLRANHQALQSFVTDHLALAAAAYAAIYIVVVALSIPGATILTLSGGLLFGVVPGGALAVVSATLGALLLFLVARTALGNALRRRAGPFLRRMEEGFRSNALSYLLFLRLVPAFPFWAVNLVSAVMGVPTWIFVSATAIGIVPGTFVAAAFGSGLADLFETGAEINLSDVFSPTLIAALVGLGILALVPAAWRRWRRR